MTLSLLMAGPLEQLVEAHSTDQPVIKPQSLGRLHYSLKVHTANCTNRYLSLTTLVLNNKGVLLNFTSKGQIDVEASMSQTCRVVLVSHPLLAIWTVLLEHSWCGGGVFVLPLKGKQRRRWDVCSVWHSPGPDVMTSTSVADVQIELNDVIVPSNFTLYARAVIKRGKNRLEEHFLSATEGEIAVLRFDSCLFISFCNHFSLSFSL